MPKPSTTVRTKKPLTGEPQERLSEQRLVEAALIVARRVGTHNLTMRELAKELGVTQMAAYYYVKNKQELLTLVVDSTLGQAAMPPPEVGPWDERITLFCMAVFEAVAAAPGVGDIMAVVGLTPQGNVLMSETLQVLLDAGFDERSALLANATIHNFTFGFFMIESRLHTHREITRLDHQPAVERVLPAARGLHGRDYFREGCITIMTGLRMILERQVDDRNRQGPRKGGKDRLTKSRGGQVTAAGSQTFAELDKLTQNGCR